MKFLKYLLIVMTLIMTGCNSDSGGDSGLSTAPGDGGGTTTTAEYDLLFAISCETPCSFYKLYKYDSKTSSASIVGDGFYQEVRSTADNYNPAILIHGTKVYFTATTTATGWEMWVYDYTQPEVSGINPKMLTEINPGTSSGTPRFYTLFNDKIYFSATNATFGEEIWVYEPAADVSVSNPELLRDINSGTSGSAPYNYVVVDGKLIFTASNGSDGFELHEYDPTVAVSGANPNMIVDIYTSGNSTPSFPAVINSKVYFKAFDGTVGSELWVYDPAQAVSLGTNPKVVSDILAGTSSSNPNSLVALDSKLYFAADNSTNGNELWTYDPAVAISGTNPQMVIDAVPGGSNSHPAELVAMNNKLYFRAVTVVDGTELFIYDPTEATLAGTNPFPIDMTPSGSSDPEWITAHNNKVYYGTNDSSDNHLTMLDTNQPVSIGTNPSLLSSIFADTLENLVGTTYSETVTE